LDDKVTHVVGFAVLPAAATDESAGEGKDEAESSSSSQQGAVQPDALLRAVNKLAGGPPAVASLKLGLTTGGVHLVTDRWAVSGDLVCW
jgi:hypothetical protein